MGDDYTPDEVEDLFDEAVLLISSDRLQVDNTKKLELYGLYKQATVGPCGQQNLPQPGILDFAGKAKRNAWNALGSMEQTEAMKSYCELVHELIPNWNPWENDKPSHLVKSSNFGMSVSRPDLGEGEEEPFPTSICDFAVTGDKEKIVELLNSGCDVNFRDECKRTALHMSIDRNHLDVAHLLIECGADVNAQDLDGFTPLHYACLCEYEDAIRLLIDNKADLNIKNFNQEMPQEFYDLTKIGGLSR